MSYSSSQGSSSGSTNIPDYAQSPFLMQLAQHAQNYADQAYGRYDSTYQPLENSLISDSAKFQDPRYLATVGGQASAGAAQAGEAQRTNTLRDLEAFGVDPSSGRYAELDQAERGRTAATQAGASQTAMRATQQAGRDMRGQALAIGQKNLDRASHNLDTASNLKYPPLGHSQTQQNTSNSMPAPRGASSSGGGSGRPSDSRDMNDRTGATNDKSNTPSGGGNSQGQRGGGGQENNDLTTARGTDGGMAKIINAPDGGGDNPIQNDNPTQGDNPFNSTGDQGGGNWDNPGGSAPGGGGSQDWGGMDYGGTSGTGNSYDDGSGSSGGSGWGDQTDNGGGDSGNYADSGYDPNASWGGGDGGGGDGGGDSYAAAGGEINGQQGGAIPTDDSPSGGQKVDDVNIHANAGEFMIPKDVAAWKGQEFFQKLIAQSRKARVTAPAHGTNNPAEAQQQGQAQNQAMGQ